MVKMTWERGVRARWEEEEGGSHACGEGCHLFVDLIRTFMWRTVVGAPQKVKILWRIHNRALPKVGFLWRTSQGAPQNLHFLWRTSNRAPQNSDVPDYKKPPPLPTCM